MRTRVKIHLGDRVLAALGMVERTCVGEAEFVSYRNNHHSYYYHHTMEVLLLLRLGLKEGEEKKEEVEALAWS